MNVSGWTSLIIAVTGLITAVTALYHALRARAAVTGAAPSDGRASPAAPPSPGASPR